MGFSWNTGGGGAVALPNHTHTSVGLDGGPLASATTEMDAGLLKAYDGWALTNASIKSNAAIALSKLQAGGVSSIISPTNPTTVSTASVHAGWGGTWKVTPSRTGKVFVFVQGRAANLDGTHGLDLAFNYGTGTAPAADDPATGTALAPPVYILPQGDITPVGNSFYVALTVGTAYWFDAVYQADSAGTAALGDFNVIIVEATN